jgi:hypothetical protein
MSENEENLRLTYIETQIKKLLLHYAIGHHRTSYSVVWSLNSPLFSGIIHCIDRFFALLRRHLFPPKLRKLCRGGVLSLRLFGRSPTGTGSRAHELASFL